MKKLVAVMMVLVTLVTGLTASAELKYRTDGKEVYTVGKDRKGTEWFDTVYYLVIESESGESVRLEVTQEEFEKIEKKERDAQKSFLAKVGTAATFWNPND